jgi:hypothetical protein
VCVLSLSIFASTQVFYFFNISILKIENNEMGGTCSAYGEGRDVYRVLLENLKEMRPLGRPRRRWEDIIKADL